MVLSATTQILIFLGSIIGGAFFLAYVVPELIKGVSKFTKLVKNPSLK